jgi:hypothetical protein
MREVVFAYWARNRQFAIRAWQSQLLAALRAGDYYRRRLGNPIVAPLRAPRIRGFLFFQAVGD